MKHQDMLSILITFLIGIVAGGYLYLTNFAGLVSKILTPDAEKAAEFVIIADAYGGCRNLCPSFQVTHDGSYRYLYVPSAGEEKIVRQGELPHALRTKLLEVVTKGELVRQSEVIEPSYCESFADGIDVIYEIELDGEKYALDSCGTAVEAKSVLWETLGSIWTYFERSGNNS